MNHGGNSTVRFVASSCQIEFRRVIAALLVPVLLAGCTTTRSVSPREVADLSQVVRIGDTVDCALHDGTRKQFRVTQVDSKIISGHNEAVAAADLYALKVERGSVGKTTLLVVGAVVVGAAVAIAASPGPKTPFHAASAPR